VGSRGGPGQGSRWYMALADRVADYRRKGKGKACMMTLPSSHIRIGDGKGAKHLCSSSLYPRESCG
jgi:hypothetical protein